MTSLLEAAGVAPAALGPVAVIVAFAVDRLAGEPRDRWHPVAWIGRALSAAGAPWPRASPHRAFLLGTLCWLGGAAVSLIVAGGLARGIVAIESALRSAGRLDSAVILPGVLLGLVLKPTLSLRMLRDEVLAVERATAAGIEPARAQLRRLVSRDTSALSESVIRESAIESLAENLNDAFVAPLFWFALGGLPAAALYRFANTADAMWGYRGRFEWAGKWAARADDVLSYVPARITALLIAAAAPASTRGLGREAAITPSPNSGWPMAMMALALGVHLSKPGVYALNATARAPETRDLERGITVAARAAWLAVGLCVAVLLWRSAARWR
ncbi:MAG TPA: adenosylcobinamide-phosphate synthase CbiB [Steroidobacteraceae bacterium]|jgi:adenosylcobinamide-phosphate synthase|nr:adenosylcobinamide-phosphate synthase CbiB [Steroidobacteraceae bacterium]